MQCHGKRGVTLMAALAAVIALSMPGFAFAGQISVQYEFEAPEVTDIVIGDQLYQRISMPNAPNSGAPGWPALPASGAKILLPPGATVTGVEIVPGEKVLVGTDCLIEPVSYPHTLSSSPDSRKLPTPNNTIYAMDTRVPSDDFKQIGLQTFRGYRMLILRLQPVQYIPATGELYYHRSMTVVIETEDGVKSAKTFRGYSEDEAAVRSMVDNPEVAYSYASKGSRGDKSYDLLIITIPALVSFFQPLKDFHDTTGILTEIHSTDDVGSDNPDDIRDYIRERYLNDGIEYVLIGGDDDRIPAKDMYVEFWDEETHYYDYDMPVDMYYSCLDGPYNYDGDDKWGEPNDGEDGGEVDLIGEVYVGRASVGGTTETTKFINKAIQYLTCEDTYLENVLLLGEHLGFSGLGEYGGPSMDQLIDGTDADSYTTVGFPSTAFTFDKVYDLEWPGNDWANAEVSTRVTEGVHVVNHYGHCWYDWCMKMHLSNIIPTMLNDDFCFMYSQGCMAGGFDVTDCWAEYATIKSTKAAFAAIMNARYGLGAYGTDGPSHRFNREFWDAVFNPDENKNSLGKANQDSKEDNAYRIDEEGMRWCHYEITLFGDPTISFRTSPALRFAYPAGTPDYIYPTVPGSFEVVVDGICGGVPVPGTGQLHYAIDRGDYQTTYMTETSPNTYQAELPAISCGASIDFYMSVEESVSGRIFSHSPESPLSATAMTDSIVTFADDFEADLGWTAEGDWARGVPTGNGGTDQQYGGNDPTGGCNGPNVYGYNLDGDYPNGLAETYLTSPAIDCSGMQIVRLRFSRWLGVDQHNRDQASVRVSNNGTDWVDIWQNSSIIVDNIWMDEDIDISEIAADQPAVYLRWTMGPTDAWTRFCGWNIDDVCVMSYSCSIDICGDADNSDSVDIDDVVHLINYIFAGGPEPDPLESADADCSGGIDIDDVVYLIGYIFSGGYAPCDVDGNGDPDC